MWVGSAVSETVSGEGGLVHPPGRGNSSARVSVLLPGPAVTRAPNFTAVQFQIVLLFPSCSAILLELVCHQL